MRLAGKVTIVTGAARGIGKGIAAACVREGSKVLLVDLDPLVREVAAAMGARAMVVDITELGAAEAALAEVEREFGPLSGLVNNAARVDEATLLTTTEEDWAGTMALNVTAPFRWSKVAVAAMLPRGTGSIVNISSIEATHVRPNHYAYVVSKSALNCMARSIASDFGRQGIRANTISPGSVRTDRFAEYVEMYPGLEQKLQDMNYAGRIGNIEEFGNAAVYLLSDETPYLNGHEMVIDGARTVVT